MAVRVKVDEDLPAEIAKILRGAEHNVKTVFEQGLQGIPDARLWDTVQSEGCLLVTADKGFANLHDYPPGTHPGVILFRVPRESRAAYISLAKALVSNVELETLEGTIVVVSPSAIRIHRGG